MNNMITFACHKQYKHLLSCEKSRHHFLNCQSDNTALKAPLNAAFILFH